MLPEKKRNLKEERQFKWGMVGIPIVVICMCGLVMGLCFYRHQWFGGFFQLIPLVVNVVVLNRNLQHIKNKRNLERMSGLKDSSVEPPSVHGEKTFTPCEKNKKS